MPSTVIAEMKYDPGTGILQVRFVSGVIYEYLKVPEEVYTAMKTSGAKGIYLNKHIKGNFDFRKINAHASQTTQTQDSKEKTDK